MLAYSIQMNEKSTLSRLSSYTTFNFPLLDYRLLTQEPGNAGLYLGPDELPLVQHQAGLQLGELLGRPVDQALHPEEGLRLQRQVLQPAPHVQHTTLGQLQGGQVPGYRNMSGAIT